MFKFFIFLCLFINYLPAFSQTDTSKVNVNNVLVIDSVLYNGEKVDTTNILIIQSTQLSLTANYSSVNGLNKYSFLTNDNIILKLSKHYTIPNTLNYLFSKVNGDLQQRELSFITMPTYKPDSGKIRYYGDIEFENSYVRSINYRYSIGVGSGYLLYGRNTSDKNKSEMLLSQFLLYENTSIHANSINIPIQTWRLSSRIKWRLLLFDNSKVFLSGYILYAPRINTSNVYKISSNISISYKVFKQVSTVLNYDYLSEKLLSDGIRKTSTVVSAGFSISL